MRARARRGQGAGRSEHRCASLWPSYLSCQACEPFPALGQPVEPALRQACPAALTDWLRGDQSDPAGGDPRPGRDGRGLGYRERPAHTKARDPIAGRSRRVNPIVAGMNRRGDRAPDMMLIRRVSSRSPGLTLIVPLLARQTLQEVIWQTWASHERAGTTSPRPSRGALAALNHPLTGSGVAFSRVRQFDSHNAFHVGLFQNVCQLPA